MPDVQTTLNGYRKDDGSPNWYYARQRTDTDAHDTDSGGSPSISVATTVRDGRGLNLTLEQNGVQLVPQSDATVERAAGAETRRPRHSSSSGLIRQVLHLCACR